VNADGSFDFVNTAWLECLGYEEEEIQDLNFMDIIHESSQSHCMSLFEKIIMGADIDVVEATFCRKSGESVEVSGEIRVRRVNGKVIATHGIFRDVTEKKKTDAQILKTLHDLRISNEELEQFAYVASHDLQEPIRLINTYASMLDEKLAGQLDESAERYMGFIKDSSTRMRDLVKGLLDFSLVGNHKMQRETTNLGELIEPILLNFTKEINEYNTEIVLNDLPDVHCDKLQVSRLMQNLLGNAVKFSRNVSGPKIVIDASENSAEFVICIKDNGIGIKDENLEKIFTIFKRLNNKELFEGHGLGMSISKKIVDLHGGKIWVESKFGHGCTVKFTLPKEA